MGKHKGACTKTKHCPGMTYALDTTRKARGGIEVAFTFNFKTGKDTGMALVYYRDGKSRPLTLNLCPWCGFDFRKPALARAEQEAKP
jgi:hypothetical protein